MCAKSVEKSIFQYDIWIIDLLGHLRIFTIKELKEEHFSEGLGFDGSSVPLYGFVNESDFIAKPDPKTLRTYPWTVNGKRVAFVIANVYEGYTLKRSPMDPRYVAERLNNELSRRGISALVSPEMEFFLYRVGNFPFPREKLPVERDQEIIAPKDGYLRHPPVDQLYEYRTALFEALDKVGLGPRKNHHEVGAGQIEVNIRADDPLRTSDNVQIFKYIAKVVARKMDLYATFMPKPMKDDNGSGMHIHISLWRNGENIFYDPNDDYAELSQTARYFIGGILYHAEALTAIVAPTVNSYKRLMPGFEAPIYICWGRKNRSALVRVPLYHRKGSKNNAKRRRLEIRSPDPLANPYLAIAAIIFAGLDGIKRKIDPGDPIDLNIYQLRKEQMEELGIRRLPHTLWHALDYLETDDYLKHALGKELIETYIEIKRKECLEYMQYITEWEYRKYFYL